MANMNMKTKGPRGYLYNAPKGGVFYYPSTTVKKLPPYKYPGYTGKPVPAVRPGQPGYQPRHWWTPKPMPQPGVIPPGPTIPMPGSYGKLAFRFALNTVISIAMDWGFDWSRQTSSLAEGHYDMAGWTHFCHNANNGAPVPPGIGNNFTQHKVKVSGDILCGEGPHSGVSQAWGTTVSFPAGSQSLAEQWGEVGSPPPNPAGWTVDGWYKDFPAPAVLPWVPGGFVQPMVRAWPLTTQMERLADPEPVAQARSRFLFPYQVAAKTLIIRPGRPPIRKPDDVHNRVPPKKNEKEDKPMDKTGRSVKEVYGALTELDDALDCMQKSLKDNKDKAHRRHVPWNKRLDLRTLRAAQEAASGNIDWAKFVECMAINNTKDAAIGGLSGAASRRLNQSPYAPRGRAYRGYGVGGGSARMR